jgi:hypothetical protein
VRREKIRLWRLGEGGRRQASRSGGQQAAQQDIATLRI